MVMLLFDTRAYAFKLSKQQLSSILKKYDLNDSVIAGQEWKTTLAIVAVNCFLHLWLRDWTVFERNN